MNTDPSLARNEGAEVAESVAVKRQSKLVDFFQKGRTEPFSEQAEATQRYSLRQRTVQAKVKGLLDEEEVSLEEGENSSDISFEQTKKRSTKRSKKLFKARGLKEKRGRGLSGRSRRSLVESDEESEEDGVGSFEQDLILLKKLPNQLKDLEAFKVEIGRKIQSYKDRFLDESANMKNQKSEVPEHAIPISADVTSFDFDRLQKVKMGLTGKLFDVIMMDPPWQLSTSQPSRGVAIAYQSLADDFIAALPIPKLQTSGFLFIWVINAKYSITVQLMERWGYRLVDELVWVKKTVTGKIAKGHGFYLQHAKETCLIGAKVV